MRLHRVVVLGAVAIAIAVISVVGEEAPREPVSVAVEAAATDPIAALQRDVDLLKEQIKRPRIAIVRSEDSRQEQATTTSEAPDPVSNRTRTSNRTAEIIEVLEARHTSEQTDRAWSDKLHAELSAALGAQTGTMMSSTQCAASLCKVTLLHETLDAQRELASSVASLPALSAGTFYHYEDGAEPPRTVLYIVREGHDIRAMLAAR